MIYNIAGVDYEEGVFATTAPKELDVNTDQSVLYELDHVLNPLAADINASWISPIRRDHCNLAGYPQNGMYTVCRHYVVGLPEDLRDGDRLILSESFKLATTANPEIRVSE